MNKNTTKNKFKPPYRRLKSVVFDYLACGIFFAVTAVAVLLIAVFDASDRNQFNIYGLFISVGIIGLISVSFVTAHIKYAAIYFPLKKDIQAGNTEQAQITVARLRPIRQSVSRYSSILIGLIIYTEPSVRKRYIMLFTDERFAYYSIKNYKQLVGMQLNISYYPKSGYIKSCEEMQKILKKLSK